MGRPTFDQLRHIDDIDVTVDPDLYATDWNGTIYQRRVSFGTNGELIAIQWEPFQGGGFCQAPSDRFITDIETECGEDPRVAFSDEKVRKKYGGHPDERNAFR